MRWYVYLILFIVTGVCSYTQIRVFPSIELVEPEFIACFLILRFESSNRSIIFVFLFTMLMDFLVLASLISGVFTMAILPFIFLGQVLKEHILPSYNDLFLFVYFFSIVLLKAFELDFFNITLQYSIGGVGMGTGALCAVLDDLCQQDASLGAVILTNCFAQEILLNAGNTDLRQAELIRTIVVAAVRKMIGRDDPFLRLCDRLDDGVQA